MKKIVTISLLILSIFTLSACSPIDSGFITKKSYSAPWQSTVYDCISRDPKTSSCTMQMPRTVHHSASWKFDLKKNDKTGWVSVNEGDYNKYKVGDCWAC